MCTDGPEAPAPAAPANAAGPAPSGAEPAPSPAAAGEPAAPGAAEPAWTRIARALQVPGLQLEIEAEEVARQEALGGLGFEAAFRVALESLLRDGGNLESPVSLFRNGLGLSEEQARARVREVLDRPTSRLGLVRLTPPGDEDTPGHFLHRPPGGEDPRQVWVFYLLTKETYDTSHWAVAPRDGGAVYNYGFN